MIARAFVVALAGTALVSPAQAGTGFRVVASLHPASVHYGDPVTAEVEVDFDPHAVDASSIEVQPRFGPYTAAGNPDVQRLRSGAVRFRYSLLCVEEGCLPSGADRRVQLPAIRARATGVTALGRFPALRVVSRLSAADRKGRIRFHYPPAPPTVRYRVAPGALAAGLIAAAALCAFAAAAFVAVAVARRAAGSRERRLTPLEVAIEYVRDSVRRGDPDRRRALELLAEAADGELGADAADRAWSQRPPTPAGAAELADRAAGAS